MNIYYIVFFFFLIICINFLYVGSYGEVYHADWNGTVSFCYLLIEKKSVVVRETFTLN